MIANLLPSEATHSSLDLFEKPSLLVTFDGSFCQKLGPVYSPNGPMLEFEVAGDRNNFIDLQKIFLEVKCKIVQSSEANLKYDGTAAADVTKTDAPYFCNNVLHSLFSDCTVSANGLKISNANGNYAHKSFIETEFSHNKDAKNTWLACQGYSYEENPGALLTTEVNRRKALVRQSNECTFYGKVAVDFFTCDRHLMSGVTLRIAFRRSIDDFVIMSDDAAKHYKVKIVEANLYVRKMTLNDDVVSAIEKTLLSSPASYPYLETLTKTFLASTGLHSWKQEDIFAREPIRRVALCLNTNEAFLGNNRQNPFRFRKFDLEQIYIYRNGMPVADSPISTNDDKRLYFNIISDLAYIDNGHGISLTDYPNHFIMVFDLTSTQQASHDFIHPELTNCSISIELDCFLCDSCSFEAVVFVVVNIFAVFEIGRRLWTVAGSISSPVLSLKSTANFNFVNTSPFVSSFEEFENRWLKVVKRQGTAKDLFCFVQPRSVELSIKRWKWLVAIWQNSDSKWGQTA